MAEDGVEVGFEDGISWLPTHVLEEACHSKEYLKNRRHPQNGHGLNFTAEPLLPHPKSRLKPHHRTRNSTNWAAGGPGMQAIFLDPSGQKSCGTGVFLPRRAGTDFKTSKKPACSPVLLPSRVVQALNLNVRKLGSQIKPPQDAKNVDRNVTGNKKGKDASAQCYVISQSRSTSPEIFLPKEWTY
ncbi:uncharacterized protein LOC130790992 [Actinidia eriantha]|uniref:uncharacterized protein LOC130790992 n=1 Tax=Actinidia eriantha TaxID=165200 RepID=UPI002588F4BF|nr:uncharacterized protein LOC130790992 [Actinidia eriantha]